MKTFEMKTVIHFGDNSLERLKEACGTVVMDIEEEWGHVQTCNDSYTSQRLDWVFGHVRP